jgi:hypothetical protein
MAKYVPQTGGKLEISAPGDFAVYATPVPGLEIHWAALASQRAKSWPLEESLRESRWPRHLMTGMVEMEWAGTARDRTNRTRIHMRASETQWTAAPLGDIGGEPYASFACS